MKFLNLASRILNVARRGEGGVEQIGRLAKQSEEEKKQSSSEEGKGTVM